MKEDFLQFAWKFRLFSSPNLITTEGEEVTVLKPGLHNTNAGPDFLEARVRIGDRLWNGHVEIHVNASDWDQHKHSDDRAYDNVILHAVFNPDRDISLGQKGDLPVLDLSRYIDMSYREKFALLDQSLSEVACASQLTSTKKITRTVWLERLSVERLERKTRGIYTLLAANNGNWRETFYQLLARNFGFKVNASGMQFLVESLPFSVVEHHVENRFQMEALFFGQSGLVRSDCSDPYASEIWTEYEYLASKYRVAAINQAVWKRLRLMPANFPELRISQFVHFLYLNTDFFSRMMQIGGVIDVKNMFRISGSEYWKNHSAFDRECKTRSVKMGVVSVENIVINTVAPLLFAYGKHKVKQHLVDIALQLMEEVKPENNKIVRSWKRNGLAIESARDSQASLELFNEYCTPKNCLNCMIGVELISSK